MVAKRSNSDYYNSQFNPLHADEFIKEKKMKASNVTNGSLVIDKGTWAVRARIHDERTGIITNKSKSTGLKASEHSRAEATRKFNQIIAKWEEEYNSEDLSFNRFVEDWLKRKEIKVRTSTLEHYRDYYRTHIKPYFDDASMADITLESVQTYIDKKCNTLSAKSVKKHVIIIKGAIVEAIKHGMPCRDFTPYLEYPEAKKFTGKIYNASQVEKLIKSAVKTGEPYTATIILCACYGLRRSEAIGLRWEDIDFNKNEMTIRNTVVQTTTRIIETEKTKTSSSQRTLSLIDGTIDYLKNLRMKQMAQGIDTDKVIAWSDGRTVRPSSISHGVQKIMSRCGLDRIRLHDLRHTAASLLLTKASMIQVQHFLGHQSLSTTINIYTHILEEERRKTSSIMGSILHFGSEI